MNHLAPHASDTPDAPFVQWAAHRDDGPGRVRVVALPERTAEVAFIAAEIQALHAGGVPFGAQAVLCRTHTTLRRIAAGLTQAGLPVIGAESPFERPEAKDMLALVSLVCEGDGRDLPRVAAFACYVVPEADALALGAAAHARRLSFPAALVADRSLALSDAGRAGLRRLHDDLDGLRDSDPWSLMARYLFERSNYLAPLLADDTPAGWRRRGTLARLLDFAHAHGQGGAAHDSTAWNGDASLLARVRELVRANEDHRYGQRATEAGADAVRLLTVHASKGLEFAAVFLPEMHAGVFPHREMPDSCPPPPGLVSHAGDERDRDEACAFFVACARARDVLTLTYTNEREPSPYLAYLGVPLPPVPDTTTRPRAAKTPNVVAPAVTPAAVLPAYTARTLDNYRYCPRQYRYAHVWGFGERIAPEPYQQYAQVVWHTLAGVTAGEIAPVADAAEAHFLAAWETDGLPPVHPSAALYRDLGTRVVREATAIVAKGGAAGAACSVPLADGTMVQFRPDWVTTRTGEQAPTVQWWHVGERRTAHGDADRLALYHAWVAAEMPGAVVQSMYLASGSVEDREPFGARKQANRLAKYAETARHLATGEFPAAPTDREFACPRCPYFVVCPARSNTAPRTLGQKTLSHQLCAPDQRTGGEDERTTDDHL